MSREAQLRCVVAAVTVLAAVALALFPPASVAFPGWWPFAIFLVISTALDGVTTKLRFSVQGSTSFIMHLASALLFGGFWGAVIAGASSLLADAARGNTVLKTTFNVSQRVLAVSVATALYVSLGGNSPPEYLHPVARLSSSAVQRDLGLFFAMAATYFCVNSVAVSSAVTVLSGRSFREVWSQNTRGVLAYDLTASAIAVLVAWFYVKFDSWFGFGALGVALLMLPIIAVRHVYGLYRELQESGQELLQLMVKAIEARDPYTSGHSLRVSRLSRTMAVELGLSAKEIDQIETAALLHDVGKIHEEFAPLLRKESRLSPEETALMQTHAVKSADLVSIISKFHGAVAVAVRHHHERWDGQGYPDGLAGERIPIGARVILVSDTIDAMTTDRPYRKRLALEVVIAELQKHSGTQFDPKIVNLAISSVAVRRLISDPGQPPSERVGASSWPRRLSWPARPLWKVRGA